MEEVLLKPGDIIYSKGDKCERLIYLNFGSI